jgi:hypothetical protein
VTACAGGRPASIARCSSANLSTLHGWLAGWNYAKLNWICGNWHTGAQGLRLAMDPASEPVGYLSLMLPSKEACRPLPDVPVKKDFADHCGIKRETSSSCRHRKNEGRKSEMSRIKILTLALVLAIVLIMVASVPVWASDKYTVCHKPGTPAEHTLFIPISAVPAHFAHGDYSGPCPTE